MKVEPNKKSPLTRLSVAAPRLMCADGSWWTIDARDPDLEDHLKQQEPARLKDVKSPAQSD